MGTTSKFALAMLVGSACLAAPSLVLAADAPTSAPATPDRNAIIVTATRQSTNIQKTSVQVSAFSTQKLQDLSVKGLNDITYLAPAVRFSSNSSVGRTYIALRGISIPPVPATPTSGQGVTVYEDEVPLAGAVLNLPTYDLADLEVLQGPQGTAFGRNTLAGAVLVAPVQPSFSQNGYIKAGYGNYSAWTLEGAGNATIIPDVLALRVSGQIQRHGGEIKSLDPNFVDQGTLATEAFRASLLFTPTAKFKNVLTLEYFHEDDLPIPTMNANQAFFASMDPTLSPSQRAQTAAQLAACHFQCFYYGYGQTSNINVPGLTDSVNFLTTTDYRIFNTTTYDVSPDLTLKNIFGYQMTNAASGANSFGSGAVPFAAGNWVPNDTLTEELQVHGRFLDGRVEATVGGFYQHNYGHPDQPNGLVIFGAGQGSAVDSQSYAGYFTTKVHLTPTVTFNGGFRYTWDSQSDCSLGASINLPTTAQCYATARATMNDGNPAHYGNGIIHQTDSAPTWAVGLDWQATPDAFFYIVSRRGYRSGGSNTPLYNSPCVTGGATGYAAGAPGNPNAGPVPPGAAEGAIGLTNWGVKPGFCPDFGLATTNGATASGKSIDLSSLQQQKPETLTDVEIGMRTDWHLIGWHERLNLTYFHYWYNNVLAQMSTGGQSTGTGQFGTLGSPAFPAITGVDPADPNFGALASNFGNIQADGVNLDLAVIPTDDLSVDFNLAYLNQTGKTVIPAAIASQVSGSSAGGVPASAVLASGVAQLSSPTAPWSFSIVAKYVLPWHPLNGDLVLNYDYFWTASWHQQGAPQPGYDLHNIRAEWNHIGGSNISAGLWVRNLVDKTYIAAASCQPCNAYLYGEPRTFGFDVSAKFH